jgi:REP element-mobilizing transposase RayT
VARKLREEESGAVHHVYARGNRKGLIFIDDEDRELYLRLVGLAGRRTGWRVLTYCLMDNHVHLLIETPQPNLGVGMQVLQGDYTRRFNERHGTVGHVFQGRYGAGRLRNEAHLWQAVSYVVCNPVDAGIVAAPEAWRWGSHAAATGEAPRPHWLDTARLLELLSAAGGDSWNRYLDVVASRSAVPGRP